MHGAWVRSLGTKISYCMVRPEIVGSHICKTPTTMTVCKSSEHERWQAHSQTCLVCIHVLYTCIPSTSLVFWHIVHKCFLMNGRDFRFHQPKIQFTPWLVPEVWEGGGSGWRKTMSSGKHWEHFKGCPGPLWRSISAGAHMLPACDALIPGLTGRPGSSVRVSLAMAQSV